MLLSSSPLRVFVFACVVALAPALGHAQSAPELGAELDSLLTYARTHNPELATATAQTHAAQERAAYAGALPDPRLRLEWMDITRGGEHGPNLLPTQVGSMRYSFMQELPWPGKRGLERDVAAANVDAMQHQASSAEVDVIARLKSVQVQRYILAQSREQTEDILHLLVRLEAAATARYSAGLAAQQDVIRAQLEQTAVRGELLELDGERLRLDAELNALLDRPGDAPLAAATALAALPDADVLDATRLDQRARQHNPQLASEHARTQSASKNRDRVRRDRYPDFSLGLAPVQMGGAVREWELMVEIAIPLQQGSRRSKEREAEAELEAARWQQESTANQVRGELHGRLAALRVARQSMELIEHSLLPQAELTYQSALSGYESGQVDFSTLLEAQRQIHQARLERAQRRIEAYTQVAQIERLIGGSL
jgi:outer membrane protein TolC